jgi:hypothetical protein
MRQRPGGDVDEGEELGYSGGLRRFEEPAFGGLAGPVVLAFGDFEGFGSAARIVDLVSDSAADVESPAGESDAGGLREEEVCHALAVGERPSAEFLHAPAVGGSEVFDGLAFGVEVACVAVGGACRAWRRPPTRVVLMAERRVGFTADSVSGGERPFRIGHIGAIRLATVDAQLKYLSSGMG